MVEARALTDLSQLHGICDIVVIYHLDDCMGIDSIIPSNEQITHI